MDKIIGVISNAPQTRSQNDDDFADRLSSRYTVVLLVVFAVLVSMNQVSPTAEHYCFISKLFSP